MKPRRYQAFNRAVALVLTWSMLWVGCAPVTSSDLRVALDQSKIKAAKKRGDTDLHIAATKGDSTAVLTLIGQGANLNARNDNDQTPLMLAIQQQQTNTAKVLIAHGAKADVADEKGDTALHHAIRAGQVDVVRVLLEKGAVLNRNNEAKQTPLILATKFDYPEIAVLLIAKGAQVAVTDGEGLAPVHYAANWRRTAVVRELLTRGVSPDVQAPKGQTALMTAAYLGDLATATLLLEKGAQVDGRDEQGRTSLHIASENGHQDIVAALLDRGADQHAVIGGRTPALLAAENDHPLVVSYLVQRGARFVPLADTERAMYASALVAQAIAEQAVTRNDLPRAREHQTLATEWFEKASTAYESAANSADNKILAKKIFVGVGTVVLVVGIAVLTAMAQQQQANFHNKQMAHIAALQDAGSSGTGLQGYFSSATAYERAFQTVQPINYPAKDFAMIGAVHSGVQQALPQGDLDLETLRDLYRKVGQQAREAAMQSRTRQYCLDPSTQEADRTTCLAGVAKSAASVISADTKSVQTKVSQRLPNWPSTPEPPFSLDAAAVTKGKVLFGAKGTCFECHGKTGKGDGLAGQILNPKPTDLTNKFVLKYQTDGERFNAMKFGIPGTGMVKMEHLSDEELWLIVAYLKQLAE